MVFVSNQESCGFCGILLLFSPSGIGEQAEIRSDEQFAVVIICFFLFNRTSISYDSDNSSLSLHLILETVPRPKRNFKCWCGLQYS